jgi:hypothetical protein
VGVLIGGIALLLLRDPVFDLRLVTESDADWYGAVYSAPPSLQLHAGQTTSIDLDVRNEGRITWTTAGAHPFALGYRWLTSDGNGVLDLPPRDIPLTHDVEPGATIHLQANIDVPALPQGSYRLDWGMIERDVLAFYERGWEDAETQVSVQQSPDATVVTPGITPRDDDEAPWVVGRLDLWASAARLIAAHPVLGVGPDNFRHFYGGELGLEAWDERVQANNLYLEVLADFGVVGFAVFIWLVVAPIKSLIRTEDILQIGVAAAVAAFLIHGMLDVFIAFTPTALLFWMLLGIAQKPQVSGR